MVETDKEVELLLPVTNEYEVAKISEIIDQEAVQQNYADIRKVPRAVSFQ